MSSFIQPLSEEFKEIYYIEGQRGGKYPYSHSLLIDDYIIDTGVSSGHLRKLKRHHPITHVILSHWHEDHIAGNRILPDAKFFAHPKDIPVIEDVSKMFDYYFTTDPEQIELFSMILETLRLENTKVDFKINDNDIIKIGDQYELQVILTPGHTGGHCCFLEKNSKIAFLADIDLSSFGPWYGGIDSSLIELEASIRRIKEIDIEIAVTSHKGVVEGKSSVAEAIKAYENTIYKRDERILSYLNETKPTKAQELEKKNIIYKYYTQYEIYEHMVEVVMIQYHFDKLEKNGIITKQDNGYLLS